jgi:hypothetical protein
MAFLGSREFRSCELGCGTTGGSAGDRKDSSLGCGDSEAGSQEAASAEPSPEASPEQGLGLATGSPKAVPSGTANNRAGELWAGSLPALEIDAGSEVGVFGRLGWG